MRRYSVKFEPSGQTVEVDEGCTILDAAHAIDLNLDHVCGGACACATCHVFIEAGFERLLGQDDEELAMLENLPNRKSTSRLACQTEIYCDISVEIPH